VYVNDDFKRSHRSVDISDAWTLNVTIDSPSKRKAIIVIVTMVNFLILHAKVFYF